MFSSLASFLFGSNTNCKTNCKTTATASEPVTGENDKSNSDDNLVDVDNLIEVTSQTPSVTGAIKRGRNKRNNARQQNKRKGIQSNNANTILTSSQNTILSISRDNCDDEFDENEWCIVERDEEEENEPPVQIDSEGESVLVGEVNRASKPTAAVNANSLAQQRRLQHISSHSLYSGPRPQKQRNYLQKTRNNNRNRTGNGLSVSTLSPSRTINENGRIGGGLNEATADGGLTTRSLYVAAPAVAQNESEKKAATLAFDLDAVNKMEESWFVTPPPCFTSIGPINMETSPYENLLIEHPSMSVYYSIKMIQEAAETFFNLDIGNTDLTEQQKVNETKPKKDTQAVQPRPTASGYRLDRQSAAQLKQDLMARDVQKIRTKKESKDICRTAIKRANKVRDIQSKNHTPRRADRQHSKIFSNVNNNRKTNCC